MPSRWMRLDTGLAVSLSLAVLQVYVEAAGCRQSERKPWIASPCVAEQQAPAPTTECMTCLTSAMQALTLGASCQHWQV